MNEPILEESSVQKSVEEAREVLLCKPEGEIRLYSLGEAADPVELREIALFYRAIFGSEPWGVLLDQKNNIVSWEKADTYRNEELKEDPLYTKEAIEETLLRWQKMPHRSISYGKDTNDSVFSFGACFRHETIDDLIEQIRVDNGYNLNDPFLGVLKSELQSHIKGEIIYIADLATHPIIRDRLDITLGNWLNMFKEIISLAKEKELTITLRTSGKDNAPLKSILEKLFKDITPIMQEKGGNILYYAFRFNQGVVDNVDRLIKEGHSREAIKAISKGFQC